MQELYDTLEIAVWPQKCINVIQPTLTHEMKQVKKFDVHVNILRSYKNNNSNKQTARLWLC